MKLHKSLSEKTYNKLVCSFLDFFCFLIYMPLNKTFWQFFQKAVTICRPQKQFAKKNYYKIADI